MNPKCGACGKTVYPVEEIKCLDKVWHKACFKCQVCGMTLNMKNYKGFDKLPYCSAHVPKPKATIVNDTPEMKRLASNTKIQSNVQYHAEFEANKAKFTSVTDDPESKRLAANSKTISNISYHGLVEQKEEQEKKRSVISDEAPSVPNVERKQSDNVPPPPREESRSQPSVQSTASSGSGPSKQSFRPPSTSYEPQVPPQSSAPSHYQQAPTSYSQQPRQSQSSQQSQYQQLQRQQQQEQQERQRQLQLQQQQQQHQQLLYQQQQQQQRALQQQQQQQRALQQQQQQQRALQQQQQQRALQQQYYQQQQHAGAGRTSSAGMQGGAGYGMQAGYSGSSSSSHMQYRGQPQPQSTSMASTASAASQMMPPPQQKKSSMPKGDCFQAIYDYDAQDDDEVSFRDGDLIINCVKIDEGWMCGTVHRTGQYGMLPANYVTSVRL